MIGIDDRMAILDLCARYNYSFDTGAAEDWASAFTPDGVFDGPAGHAKGTEELIRFCTDAAEQFPGAMHFTDNHLFEETDGIVQHRCFLSFQMPSDDGTEFMLLGYEDELVKVDGEWRFRSRRVTPLRSE